MNNNDHLDLCDDHTWIQTFSGRQWFLAAPRVRDVCIEDIAHGLAIGSRYAGQSRVPLPIAQHSVIVSEIVCELGHPEQAFAALMHDATEAYCGDWSSPLKRTLDKIAASLGERQHYRELYANNEAVVFAAFDIALPLHPVVHRADLIALADERVALMHEPPRPWKNPEKPTGRLIEPWSWREAERRFLDRFYALGGKAVA